MSNSPQPSDNLDDVDRQIRIEKMKQELNEISGGQMIYGTPNLIPPEMEEEFLERVLAFERAEFDTNFNRLVRRGISLPPAVELDDRTLTVKLEEIICELAEMRCFLENTDHLSARELYDWLWSRELREESADLSSLPDGAWHLSPIGAGSEEDMAVWLTYYASEKDRQRWHRDFPETPIPERKPLPFHRDHLLPKPIR